MCPVRHLAARSKTIRTPSIFLELESSVPTSVICAVFELVVNVVNQLGEINDNTLKINQQLVYYPLNRFLWK